MTLNGRPNALFSLKAKRIMTSFDLASVIQELNEIIIGSRLENIYQVSPLSLLLIFSPPQRLIVEAGKRIHITKYEIEKPSSPSLFCRILRKYLRGGFVQKVQMDDFERIVSIEITSKGRVYKLVIEIFGKGNIILINEKDIILHALSYRRMRDREIIRGNTLVPPPSRGFSPLNLSRNDFEKIHMQKEDAIKSLSKLITVGGLYAEELLLQANVDKNKIATSLTNEEIEKIYNGILKLVSSLNQREPHIVIDDRGKWVDVLPFPLKIYSDFQMKSYLRYNEAVDEYFIKLSMENESGVSNEIVQSIDEQKRILNKQNEYSESIAHAVVENRRIGDKIYQHFVEIQNLFQLIEGERIKGLGWDKILSALNEKKERNEFPAKIVDSINLKEGVLILNIDGFFLKLDIRRTVSENAALFYKEAKELETKIVGLKNALSETKSKMEKLGKAQLKFKIEKTLPLIIREKAWYEKFHWTKSSENFLILGGRDANSNELLIKKHMEMKDLVFHSDIAGAPFVVLKTEGNFPAEQTLFEAAQLAAAYSRAWREGYTSLDVYWVKPEQISKQAPSGEFLSKGMFMIRGQKNYIHNVPLRILIGAVEDEGRLIIGGPVTSISSQTKYTVELIPGRQTSGAIAKMIRNRLAINTPKELREKILKVKIEEIQKFIPSGKSEIVGK